MLYQWIDGHGVIRFSLFFDVFCYVLQRMRCEFRVKANGPNLPGESTLFHSAGIVVVYQQSWSWSHGYNIAIKLDTSQCSSERRARFAAKRY